MSGEIGSGLFSDSLKSNGKVFIGLSAIGGFVSDVLQPIAPFAEYLLYVSSVLLILTTAVYFTLKSKRQKVSSVLALSLVATFITGSVVGIQGMSDGKNGVLAEYVPGIENLQSSLGVIEKDIAEIKKDTSQIKQATTEINEKLDDIGESFEQFGKLGGLVNEPSTAVEYLNNATIYEERGDRNNALKSYEDYFDASTVSYYDPYEKYMDLLESTYSQNKGKRKLNAIEKNKPNDPSLKLIVILYNDSNDLVQQLQTFVDENERYIPGYLALLSNLPDNGLITRLKEVDLIKTLRTNASLDLIKEQYISTSSELLAKINELFHKDLLVTSDFLQFKFDYYGAKKLIVIVSDKKDGREVMLKFKNGAIAQSTIIRSVYKNGAVFRLRDFKCGGSKLRNGKLRDCSEPNEAIYNISPGIYLADIYYTNSDDQIIKLASDYEIDIPEYTATIDANILKDYKQDKLHVIPFNKRKEVSASLNKKEEYVSGRSVRSHPYLQWGFLLEASEIWPIDKISDNSLIWIKDEKGDSVQVSVVCDGVGC